MEMTQRKEFLAVPEPYHLAPSEYYGPQNFHWLIRGRLAGMPRPGLLLPMEKDLESLNRMGISLLVTLTKEWEPPVSTLKSFNIDSLNVPIVDMGPPTIEQACMTCAKVDEYVSSERAVVFHCHGGHGRTGTLLASQLIWYSPDSDAAIKSVKRACNKWIESEEQMEFLEEFAAYRRETANAF